MTDVGQSLHLQLYQPFGGKADHLARNIGIRALLKHRAKRHHLVGHRDHPSCGLRCGDQALPKNLNDRPAVANRPAYASHGRALLQPGSPQPIAHNLKDYKYFIYTLNEKEFRTWKTQLLKLDTKRGKGFHYRKGLIKCGDNCFFWVRVMMDSQVNLLLKEDLSSLELSIGRPGEPALAKADFATAELEALVAALIACVGQMKSGKAAVASQGTMNVPPPFVNPAWRSGYDVSGNAVLCFQLVRGCWVSFQLPQHEVANLAQSLRKFLNIGHLSSSKSH